MNNINIYTLQTQELDFENQNKNIICSSNMNQTMFVFQLMMFSSQAGQHSEDLSNKIQKRVSKKGGVTISTKTGKRWGGKPLISNDMKDLIKLKYKKRAQIKVVTW